MTPTIFYLRQTPEGLKCFGYAILEPKEHPTIGHSQFKKIHAIWSSSAIPCTFKSEGDREKIRWAVIGQRMSEAGIDITQYVTVERITKPISLIDSTFEYVVSFKDVPGEDDSDQDELWHHAVTLIWKHESEDGQMNEMSWRLAINELKSKFTISRRDKK